MTFDSVVFLNAGSKGRMVRVGEIVTIEVEKNDLTFKLNDNTTYVTRGSLTKCLDKLSNHLFFVAGRYCAVNLLYVKNVDAACRNILLELKDGRPITLSRQRSLVFRKQLTL